MLKHHMLLLLVPLYLELIIGSWQSLLQGSPKCCSLYSWQSQALPCVSPLDPDCCSSPYQTWRPCTNKVSLLCADFIITGSVAAVIDVLNPVAITWSFQLWTCLVFIQSLLAYIAITKSSSSPFVGFGPHLTDGFVHDGFANIYETADFTHAIILISGASIW